MCLPFEIDGRTYWINLSKQVLPALDALGWLENNPLYPKVFWRDRDGQVARAAVGNLLSFPRIPRFSGGAPFEMRLYGGIRFLENSHREDTTWKGFPKTCFWLPQIELSQSDEKTEAIFYSLNRGNCKTPRQQKIDDFGTCCQNPHSGFGWRRRKHTWISGCEDTRRSGEPSQCKAGERRSEPGPKAAAAKATDAKSAILCGEEFCNSLDSEHFEIEPSCLRPSKTYSLIDRLETPALSLWKENVDAALKVIASGELNKIVLARKTTLQFSQPVSIWSCLNQLMDKAKHATIFAFQFSPSLCFLGATPEKLFERVGQSLSADVLAGTRPRGTTSDEDLQYEQELFNSAKDRYEFQIVKNFLQMSISPLSKEMKWGGQDSILKASHVQHIHNRLNVVLRRGIFDEELIEALHPTPALGGFPREKAVPLLRQMESFDRGWYGGPIGIISPEGANLYVAIRSALIRERSLHLFAGTGIVQGSIAEQEWEELEQKIRPFTELFL